ncbi:hypothetical protein DRO61_04750 [Candidatus Bathyarchaeota archaeon]|nr:MAG: hypothetical protein DRO61_04750 [Candidatus Bathyarchaeota archaeon]
MCDSLQEILVKLNEIEEKIDLLQETCTLLNERLDNIEVSTGVMDEHVQWVNDVHNVIKKPLFTTLNAINSIVSPFSETMVDVEKVPNAPAYQHSLTHVEEKE